MTNCLFCDIKMNCTWAGVDRWVDCPNFPDEEDEDERNNRLEYEEEMAELEMEEERWLRKLRH